MKLFNRNDQNPNEKKGMPAIKNKKLFGIIMFVAIVAAGLVVVGVMTGNYLNKNKPQITASADEKETKDTKKDAKEGYIIKGLVDAQKGEITTKDGKVYTIEKGVLYVTEKDGKKEKVTDDLSLVKVYDDNNSEYLIADGKLEKAIKEEATTTQVAAETTTPAQAQNTDGDAYYGDGQESYDNGETYSEGESESGPLPWLYWYPTESGIYCDSDYPQFVRGGLPPMGEGLTAEQIAQLDEIAWKWARGEISAMELSDLTRPIFEGGSIVYRSLHIGSYYGDGFPNAKEYMATHGYAYFQLEGRQYLPVSNPERVHQDDFSNESWMYCRYFFLYDAVSDTLTYTSVGG